MSTVYQKLLNLETVEFRGENGELIGTCKGYDGDIIKHLEDNGYDVLFVTKYPWELNTAGPTYKRVGDRVHVFTTPAAGGKTYKKELEEQYDRPPPDYINEGSVHFIDPLGYQNEWICKHEPVNVSLIHVKLVCKKCDKDLPQDYNS